MSTPIHIEHGSKEEIAIVLSCPGQEEESANPPGPAKGNTGRNLDDVLKILREEYNQIGYIRGDVLITNAWDNVEYKNKTKRSEATLNEVLTPKNLNRLAAELSNINDTIICCGVNATTAVAALSEKGKLHKNVKCVSIEHLGNQALNRLITKDINQRELPNYRYSSDKPATECRSLKKIRHDNRIARLKVVANDINRQIQQLTQRPA